MNWKRWNWLDDGVLPVAIVSMRATWLYALVRALAAFARQDGARELIGFGTLVWLPLAAFACGRLARRESLDLNKARLFVAIAGLLAITLALWVECYAAFAPWNPAWLAALVSDTLGLSRTTSVGVLVIIALGALLWWRGLVAGQASLAYDNVYGAFALGVVLWALLLVFAYGLSAELLGLLGRDVLLFFFVSLGALALAGLESARRTGQRETGVALGLNRYWLFTVFLVIGGVLGSGLLLSLVFAPDTVRAFIALFDPLLGLLGQLAWSIFYVVVLLIFLVLTPVIEFLRALARANGSEQQPLEPPKSFQDMVQDAQQTATGLPPEALFALKLLIVIIGAALVALLFAWALRRYRRVDAEGVEESREFIGSWALVRAQLGQWWRALLARLFARRAQPAGMEFLALDLRALGDGRLSIREIYQLLLAAMRQRGQPRPPSATPHEYLGTLQAALPGAEADLAGLTDAYADARYGPAPLPDERVSRVNEWWRRVRQWLESE